MGLNSVVGTSISRRSAGCRNANARKYKKEYVDEEKRGGGEGHQYEKMGETYAVF